MKKNDLQINNNNNMQFNNQPARFLSPPTISSEHITYNIIGEEPNNNNTNNRSNVTISNIHPIRNNNFHISSFALSSNERNNYEIRPENPNIKAKIDPNNNISNIISQLPENKIENLNKLNDENKTCVICLDEYKINDTTIMLPCFHFFHKTCIINWAKKKVICPLCKLDIKKYI